MKSTHWALAGTVATLVIAATPASAERLYSYWKLEPTGPQGPQVVTYGQPFGEQRLLPGRLVELDEPVTVKKNQTLAKGTPLYVVFSGDHKQKLFCTVKDLTKTSAGEVIIGPLVNKRPCFMDSDNDGRLDKVFSVIDIVYAPPSSRGDLGSAKPIEPVAYKDVDPHSYPVNMTLSFKLSGSSVDNTRITPDLANAGLDDFQTSFGKTTPDGYFVSSLGTIAKVDAVDGDKVTIELFSLPNAYIVHGWMSVEVRELPESLFTGDAPADAAPATVEPEKGEPPASPETSGSPETQP